MGAAFRAAFKASLPIALTFIMVGISYGIYVVQLGLPSWLPSLLSLLLCAGSMEFLLASLLLQALPPVQIFLITLLVNARHLFYGLSFLERYRGLGLRRYYMIYALVDETFAINQSIQPPAGVLAKDLYLAVTLWVQGFWVLSASLGGLIGPLIHVKIPGLDFLMPALFSVLFLSQLDEEDQRGNALFGFGAALVSLLLFGPKQFMLWAMALILGGMYLRYRREAKA